ncbi:hypothetical protein HDR58_06970 [bacterium]|nr:hypothetical protein [bacterium]
MGNLLTVCRAFGANNISELQKLRKTVQADEPGKAIARFVFNGKELMDSFQSSLPSVPESAEINPFKSLLEKFFPKGFSENSRTFIDVILHKFGRESYAKNGSLTVFSRTKNAGELVHSNETRVLSNSAGAIIDMVDKSEVGTANVFAHYSSMADKSSKISDLLNSITYNENKGIAHATIDYSGQGSIKALRGDVKAPVEFVDSYTRIMTGGEYHKLPEMIEATKILSKSNDAALEVFDI